MELCSLFHIINQLLFVLFRLMVREERSVKNVWILTKVVNISFVFWQLLFTMVYKGNECRQWCQSLLKYEMVKVKGSHISFVWQKDPIKLNGKFYIVVVMLALLYGSKY